MNSLNIPTHKEAPAIIPFCIYHYINPGDNTYRGIISNPIIERGKDGKTIYKCPETLKDWKFAGLFYAISPLFRPIPIGMNLYCAEISKSYMTDLRKNYDLFTFKDNCVYFMTYNKPALNTVPLYFYQLGTNVFPSFDENPPAKDWNKINLSPLFVIPGNIDNPEDLRFIPPDFSLIA